MFLFPIPGALGWTPSLSCEMQVERTFGETWLSRQKGTDSAGAALPPSPYWITEAAPPNSAATGYSWLSGRDGSLVWVLVFTTEPLNLAYSQTHYWVRKTTLY